MNVININLEEKVATAVFENGTTLIYNNFSKEKIEKLLNDLKTCDYVGKEGESTFLSTDYDFFYDLLTDLNGGCLYIEPNETNGSFYIEKTKCTIEIN